MVKIKFFAQLRETLGVSTIELEGAAGQSVAAIKSTLAKKAAPWQILVENDILNAVNHTISNDDTVVNDGDEVAFFPPVTGG
ncbi:molybdopterin converting factor subunit 1 [Glaciecola sp. SC05]|uniref:molybdopterin converting factor subunit 1 n=1 Tax=Glaciecola sp. SC05 TaxID=1987355 RepID=UPI003529970F